MGRLGDQARVVFVTEMDESPTDGAISISISISSSDEESDTELTWILPVESSTRAPFRAFDVALGSK